MKVALAYGAYYGLARYLPWSFSPGGGVARRVREALCRVLFRSCGESVNVEPGVWFGSGRDVSLGDRSGLGKDMLIMGGAVIGADVMVGPRVVFLSTNHNFSSREVPMNRQGLGAPQPVSVGDDVWIGAGVIVLPGRHVGTGSVVAAGCVVTKDVEPFSIVGGNPMRTLGQRQ